MPEVASITLEEMIACIKREIGFRKTVYEKRVRHGYMTQEEADREIVIMQAVLEQLKAKENTLFNQET